MRIYNDINIGQVPERSKGTRCRRVDFGLRGFESLPAHRFEMGKGSGKREFSRSGSIETAGFQSAVPSLSRDEQ